MVGVAIVMVCIYTFFMLGTFSTIHCRVLVALCGIICIVLAYTSGFGLMYLCGARSTGVH
jgi:hypothetical protein